MTRRFIIYNMNDTGGKIEYQEMANSFCSAGVKRWKQEHCMNKVLLMEMVGRCVVLCYVCVYVYIYVHTYVCIYTIYTCSGATCWNFGLHKGGWDSDQLHWPTMILAHEEKCLFLMYFWALNSNVFPEVPYHSHLSRCIRLMWLQTPTYVCHWGPVGGTLDMM